MFALPGLLALILVDYLRPQEYLPALRSVPLLHLAAVLAGMGLVLDLRLGLSRLRAAPHLALTLLFFVWCLLTVVARAPAELLRLAPALLVPLVVYLLVSHSIQGFRMLQVVCALLLGIALVLAAIGVHQGMAPTACYRVAVIDGDLRWLYDGRPCSSRFDCEDEGAEPGADYACEKVGLFGTSSINGRVRFRGTLEDPNELSLVLSIALPFAFAFLERRRTLPRLLLVVLTTALVGLCAFFTQSRGGQLVVLTVLAVYFVRLVGPWRGLAAGAVLALPILVFGGRSGAEDSTMERIECWWTGLHLFVSSPAVGVGAGQFTEHHYLTAHNSYILAAAELGLPGLLLWTSVVYLSVKILVTAQRAQLAPVGRSWALALLASMAGLLVGILFLSFIYKDVLWLYVGLTGVLYQAIRGHDPTFKVTFGLRDAGLVALLDAALVIALVGYTGSKLGW